MKKKLLVFLILLFLVGVGAGSFYYFATNQTEQETQIIDVVYESKLLQSFEVNENTKILINDNEVSFKEDTKTIDADKYTKKSKDVFYTWSISEKENLILIKQEFKDSQDFTITFVNKSDHANILVESRVQNEVSLPTSKDKSMYDYLPIIEIEEDYDYNLTIGKGEEKEFYIKDLDLLEEGQEKKELKTDKDLVVTVNVFEDKNKNGIDDSTEKFKISYVTNNNTTLEDLELAYGETLGELPILSKENTVFIDWFADEDMTEKVTKNTVVTSDMTLYAQFLSFNGFINSSVENPITRKDLSLQLETLLNDYNNNLTLSYNKEVERKEAEKKAEEKYNRENNIYETDKKQVIEFHNKNQDKLFLITFLDEQQDFKFSLVAPYGQTIKVFDSKDNLMKEYSVRQATTITLKNKEYSSEYYKINNSVYIKISEMD